MALDLQPILDMLKPALAFAKPLVPPFVGATIGFFLEKEQSRGKKLLAFAVGFSVAVYSTDALASHYKISDVKILGGIAFALGMFGKTLISAVVDQIPKTLASLSEKVVGLFPGGSK